MLEFTRLYLDPISIWIGLIVSVPIFWTWYDIVWGGRKRHQTWFEQARSTPGKLPAALIVDLLAGRDIVAQVRHFMAGQEGLRDIPDERIVRVTRDCDLTPQDMPQLARDIQDAIAKVSRLGADELNVFFAGPTSASAILGAELANVAGKVLLFQNDRTSNTYVNFGPLRHPRF